MNALATAPTWFVDLARRDRPRSALVPTGTAAAAPASRVYPDGARNDSLYRDGCRLRRAGCSPEELPRVLAVYNEARCDPPLSVAEVATIAASAARQPEGAQPFAPGPLVGVSLADAFLVDVPLRVPLLDPLLAGGEIALLFGPRGSGKTWVACAVAVAVAGGVEVFGRWRGTAPRVVCYVDGEQGFRSLRERIMAMANALGVTDDERLSKLYLLPDDRQPDGLPSLLDEEGQARIDAYLDEIGAELVIVDNLSALAGARDENDAAAVDPIVQWMRRQKRKGRASIIVHHAGKDVSRGTRGTSRLEDPVELILAVTRPPGATPADGAVFRVTCPKARHVFGEALEPFEAAIRYDESGIRAHLEVRDGNALRDTRIVELDASSMTQREIAEEIGCSPATVNGVLKRHRERRG